VVVVVAGMVAGAVLVACGGSGADQAVKTVDLGRVAEASKATTARIAITQQADGKPAGSFEGETDFEARSAHLKVTTAAPPTGLPAGDLGEVPEEVRAQIQHSIDVMASAEEFVIVDDHGYVLSKGTWWDLGPNEQDAADEERGDADVFDPFAPSEALDRIAKIGAVRTVGRDEVRGVATTRYAATDRRTDYRYDVWVDGEGRAVKIRADTTLDDGTKLSGTMEIYDFGTPVSIEAPTDSKPLDLMNPAAGAAPDVELREVASGKDSGVAWTLSTGSAPDGRGCVQVSTDPGLESEVVQISGMVATNANLEPDDDPVPSCGPTSVNGAMGSSGATLLTVGGKSGERHYLAGLIAEGAEVTVTFPDGREEQLEDRGGAFILWFTGDWPVRWEGGNATCDLQGDETMSGVDLIC
jgi:hypothetical protein